VGSHGIGPNWGALKALIAELGAKPLKVWISERIWPSEITSKWSVVVFTVRRKASHGLCDRNSVRLSVHLSVRLSVHLSVTHGLCPHGSTYDHDFFTIW